MTSQSRRLTEMSVSLLLGGRFLLYEVGEEFGGGVGFELLEA